MAVLAPQPGPQYSFLGTPADIAIFGGAAGGGKTFGLLLEAARHVANSAYNAVIFRRNTPQVRNPGGLWHESQKLFPLIGGRSKESVLEWHFHSGSVIKFSHLEHEDDKHSWQGAQLVMIGFDELTHFTENQFWFLLSRARSTSGIRPLIRATCNPDPDSFVAKLVEWWIDPETGLPIRERSGKLRYFVRRDDNLIWGDSPEEAIEEVPDAELADVRSFTFVISMVQDNPILMRSNPEYMSMLRALPLVERQRLLLGNWKIRNASGNIYRRGWISIVDALPAIRRTVRYWDRAASKAEKKTGDPDYTAGVRMSVDADGTFYIEHVANERGTPLQVQQLVRNTASQDGPEVEIGLEQDPGQAGVVEVDSLIRDLAGYSARAYPVRKDKVARAKPGSAQAEAGNIKMLRGEWNDTTLTQMENFPEGKHDDIVDAVSGALLMLTGVGTEPNIRSF